MDYEEIRYEIQDGVAVVTLDRPQKLNAVTAQTGAELGDAMAEADEDDDVRVVVLTGAGRAFCAGLDFFLRPRCLEPEPYHWLVL